MSISATNGIENCKLCAVYIFIVLFIFSSYNVLFFGSATANVFENQCTLLPFNKTFRYVSAAKSECLTFLKISVYLFGELKSYD